MNEIQKIKDNYREAGDTFEEFKRVNREITDITMDKVVYGSNITFLSLCEVPEVQMEGKVIFYILNGEYIRNFLESGRRLVVGRVSKNEIPDELLNELRNTTGLMAIIGDDKYIVSDIAIPTLTIRASVSGNLTINRQNLIRNLHLADAILSKNEKIHIVYREVEVPTEDGGMITIRKILAGLGSAYQMVPQTIITKTAEKLKSESVLGDMEVRDWSIDHIFTDLHVEFPDAAKDFQAMYKLPEAITPGVFLCTSDVGKSSVIARGVYRLKGSYVITDEVMIKHTGDITPESVTEKIDEEIFTNIRKLPEALSELIGRDIIDYSKVDLSSETGAAKNHEAVLDTLESTLKKVLKSVLPVKRQVALLECLVDEIDSSRPYTLYDIATTFMSIPDRVEGIDEVTLTDVRKACAKTPFILIDKKSIKKEEEAEIVLLPA